MNVTASPWALSFLEGSRFWIQKVLVPVVVTVGTIGSLLTIIVLTRKRMKSSTNTYLTALAVSDLIILVTTFSLSFENYEHMASVDYLIYWKYWRFGLWIVDAACAVSIWLTVSFTLERYVAVCHPLKGKVLCTITRARRVIFIIFILGPLVTVTTPFEWRVTTEFDHIHNITIVKTKPTELATNEYYYYFFYWFWAITIVFIPLILLAILNYLLISAVNYSRRHRSNLTQVESRGSYKERQENKITMTLVAVVFLFLICQTPTAFTVLVKSFYHPSKGSTGDFVLRGFGNIFNFLVVVNAAANFFLYCFMSDKYRHTFLVTFFPSLAYKHRRANTFTSNASFRQTSIRYPSAYS